MTHPIIPPLFDLATPIAASLGLEIVDIIFQTNKRPPVLRIDIRNPQQDTSLEDCEKMSRALDVSLDNTSLLPTAYVLEVSSPGITRQLTSERDFLAFKGFSVVVTTQEPFEGQKQWQGRLQGKDEHHLTLNLKGRGMKIPLAIVATVQLDSQR
jgi:ribosome maturation factor RimP